MPVIAVDGPAASGKGTIARALAAHWHLPHLDTGALYRAVAATAMRREVPLDDEAALGAIASGLAPPDPDDPVLRTRAIADAASKVSALHAVRAALLAMQRSFAGRPGGAVLDGRDIGTVIAPFAEAKLFVTAQPEIRARRRFLELRTAGAPASEEAVLADIHARDARDMARAEAPLRRAVDADLLDTSAFGKDEAVRRAIELVSARLDQASC